MPDFFEIDFLAVETKKSGDAIALRYGLAGEQYIHVVDGGFQETGEKVVEHLKQYYAAVPFIDHVVVTHADGDHAGGLRTVLKDCNVGALWMLRPWLYAEFILDRFGRVTSVENLRRHLREAYPNLVALEEIAERQGIPIHEPFQGAQIGAFTVLAPSPERFLDCVVESERTPESKASAQSNMAEAMKGVMKTAVAKAVNLVRAAWGEEIFSVDETSAENEMSVVQFATLCGERILLTGDSGRSGLSEAADYATAAGLVLPGIHKFQVPHHGSRRNVSTALLDRWLGARLERKSNGGHAFAAMISSAKEDDDHPRDAVVRAMYHRGGTVVTTEGVNRYWFANVPLRPGWSYSTPVPYPETQETD